MSAQEPIVIDPSETQAEAGRNKIDPTSYKWKLGDPAISVELKMGFDWCPITFYLNDITKPFTFEDLNGHVENVMKKCGQDIYKNLFATWFNYLNAIGLIDVQSFQDAAAKRKAQNEQKPG